MPILRGDQISSSYISLGLSIGMSSGSMNGGDIPLDKHNDKYDNEISPPRNIGIYMTLFQQNCNNLKMAAMGRNM